MVCGCSPIRTAWIESPNRKVFFSGDTGLTPEFAAVGERFGPFDLVMLEIGAWHPAWGTIHLGPENALKVFEMRNRRSTCSSSPARRSSAC